VPPPSASSPRPHRPGWPPSPGRSAPSGWRPARTLGGGYGLLNGRFGLAADNLLGADLVLADGQPVSVDDDHEPELFWAIRGGGNFGVVTSMRIWLHAVGRVLAGMIGYPLGQAAIVLEQLDEIIAAATDELTVQAVILTGPDGTPGVFLVPAWSGDLTAGEPHIERLQRLGTPVFTQVGPMAFSDLLHMNDARARSRAGTSPPARCRVPHYSPAVIDALIDAAQTLSSPFSGVAVHNFHGAAARVPVESTAFGIRQPHLITEIIGWWEPGDAAPHEAWADKTFQALAPEALPGGYPNMLGPAAHRRSPAPTAPTPPGSWPPRHASIPTAFSPPYRCQLRRRLRTAGRRHVTS